MNMENPEVESTRKEIFIPGDKVKFLGDGREGIVVVENSPSLLPKGIVEVRFDGEAKPEGVQVSDLEKVEKGEGEIEKAEEE